MAKKFFRKYYKKYNRKSSSFFKAVSNYHYAKLSFNTLITYSGSNLHFDFNNNTKFDIGTGIRQCADWKPLCRFYLFYKLRGIAMIVNPHPNNEFIGGSVVLGLLSSNDSETFGDCVEGDKSISLTFTQTMRKYISLKRSGSWQPTDNDAQSGKFVLNASGQSSSGSFQWDVTFNFYILFKSTA